MEEVCRPSCFWSAFGKMEDCSGRIPNISRSEATGIEGKGEWFTSNRFYYCCTRISTSYKWMRPRLALSVPRYEILLANAGVAAVTRATRTPVIPVSRTIWCPVPWSGCALCDKKVSNLLFCFGLRQRCAAEMSECFTSFQQAGDVSCYAARYVGGRMLASAVTNVTDLSSRFKSFVVRRESNTKRSDHNVCLIYQ